MQRVGLGGAGERGNVARLVGGLRWRGWHYRFRHGLGAGENENIGLRAFRGCRCGAMRHARELFFFVQSPLAL